MSRDDRHRYVASGVGDCGQSSAEGWEGTTDSEGTTSQQHRSVSRGFCEHLLYFYYFHFYAIKALSHFLCKRLIKKLIYNLFLRNLCASLVKILLRKIFQNPTEDCTRNCPTALKWNRFVLWFRFGWQRWQGERELHPVQCRQLPSTLPPRLCRGRLPGRGTRRRRHPTPVQVDQLWRRTGTSVPPSYKCLVPEIDFLWLNGTAEDIWRWLLSICTNFLFRKS